MKNYFNNLMQNLKKQNPKASWLNLSAGIFMLIVTSAFAYNYFNKVTEEDFRTFSGLGGSGSEVVFNAADIVSQNNVLGEQKQNVSLDVPADERNIEFFEALTTAQLESIGVYKSEDEKFKTKAQKSEGLWQVALRVCNDGESYRVLAAENGLGVWQSLELHQELAVICL